VALGAVLVEPLFLSGIGAETGKWGETLHVHHSSQSSIPSKDKDKDKDKDKASHLLLVY